MVQEGILQRFLDLGMLDIGEDDEKFEHLQNSAVEIAGALVENRPDLIRYTAVGFDPEIPIDEPLFDEIEEVLKDHWRTYRNKFPDKPKQVLRAVILEALRIAAMPQIEDNEKPDVTNSAIVYLTGVSLLPFTPLGRERPVCSDLISWLGKETEHIAIEMWSPGHMPVLPSPPDFVTLVKNAKKHKAEVDEDALTTLLMAAAGPAKDSGNTVASGPNANPNFPSQQNGVWVEAFGSRAGAGIAKAVNEANSGLVAQVDASLKQLALAYAEFAEDMMESIQEFLSKGITLRTNLFWLKETLYSPSLRLGYRTLDPTIASVAIAYDLHLQTPRIHPQSIEFFLRESVRDFQDGRATEEFSLSCLLQRVHDESQPIPAVRQLLGHRPLRPGRLTLLEFTQALLAGELLSDDVDVRIGVRDREKITLADLAVWLYRDLQARRLTVEG